jgi:hypothetical protein
VQRLPLLRLLSFTLPFLLVVGLFWFLPMAFSSSKTTTVPFGQEYAYTVDERGPFDRNLSWKTTVTLPSSEVYVLPRLPYWVVTRPGSDPGGTALYLDFQVFLNGKMADRYALGISMDSAGGGTMGGNRVGVPTEIEDVDQSLLHEGINDVEIRLHLFRAEGTTGTGTYSLTVGPATVETIHSDRDHDGVRDDRQPVPGVHTGWIAVPLGLTVGLVGLVVFNRRKPGM